MYFASPIEDELRQKTDAILYHNAISRELSKPARKWRIRQEKHLQSLDPRLPNKCNLVRSIYQIIDQMFLLTDIIQGKSKLFM